MKLQYIFAHPDDQVRAEVLIRALFESDNKSIEDHLGTTTVTLSDKEPCFYVFDGELTKHPGIGWRLAAKYMGEKFFGQKPDVIKVAQLAEQYYTKELVNQTKEDGKRITIEEIPDYPEKTSKKIIEKNNESILPLVDAWKNGQYKKKFNE